MLNRSWLAILVVVCLVFSSVSYAQTAGGSVHSDDRVQIMKRTEREGSSKFLDNLPEDFEFPEDDAGELLFREYGAVYVAQNGIIPPKKIFFTDEADVQEFQESVETESEKLGGINIELQKPAMRDLEAAVKAAKKQGVSITPRGVDSGRRGYSQTIALWKSRVEPGLAYWVRNQRLKVSEAAKIHQLPTRQQITEILRLEKQGIYFAKSLDKSIIYSVAPPGSSQHIAMLALDVKEFDDPRARAILAEHGWFQTVLSDLPHFTYLGVKESKLPTLGLKRVELDSRVFWVPDLPAPKSSKKAR